MVKTSGRRSTTKSIRIIFKQFAQEVLPRASRRKVVFLEPKDGTPVVAQLRAVLANKSEARRFVEQLEIYKTAHGPGVCARGIAGKL